jgi:serine/threonine protein kinase
LQPEDEIGQYRVVGPLGAGGMGEVYLAQDRTLERNVALKVLPPDLVKSEDRVRRFVQEAKSASSLNHPNIVTIYEIGQESVRPASGEVSSGPVQYISMELISGKTLGAKIHEEKTDVRTLLSYLAQAAEGIAKAHAAGIVHRDLKPGNIMVSDDGFAKVLDFGLAKLTEKRGPESASATAMTEVAERTSEGAVLGTVHYMSPEQVQGRSVDHRSDVFSFGVILYEAATGQRPFVADSNVETMHKILNEKPRPIEEINPAVPAELRRLVRRCLAKAPDQRLQSMKDLAIELREIVDEYDSLSASATSATSASSGSGGVKPISPQRSRTVPIVVGAILIAAAGIGYGLWSSRRGGEEALPFQSMRATTQTSRGDVNYSALSPDGRYLAYVAGVAGRSTLRVRQVATGSDVEVLPVQEATFESPSFSPDGNYLYFLKRSADRPNYRSLVRVPSLGGPEEERAFDVDSRVTFSPDAKQVCFVRGIPQEGRSALILRDLDTGAEREFANVRQPEVIAGSPSWSPDGRRIAVFAVTPPPEAKSILAMFEIGSGRRDDSFVKQNAFLVDVAWIPDGRGLVAAGTIVSEGIRNQLFLLTYPGGKLTRVTNDFDTYAEVSVAGGEGAIAALRTSEVANLFVADPTAGTVHKLTNATSPEHSPFAFDVAADRVAFPAVHQRRLGIGVVPLEGGEQARLAAGPGHVTRLFARGNAAVFQRYDEDQHQHIWRMNLDGTGLQAVTNAGGETVLDVTLDGRLAAFTYTDSTRGVWVVPVGGGDVVPIAPRGEAAAVFSPDGKEISVVTLTPDASGFIQTVFTIFPSSGGPEIRRFAQQPDFIDIEWELSGTSLTYLGRDNPARNVFRYQIEGNQVTQITRFADGRVTDHEWSPDAGRIAIVHRGEEGENVWVVDAGGSAPKQVTRFDGEDVFQIEWTLDGRRVVVRAGTQSRDVVLISDFR